MLIIYFTHVAFNAKHTFHLIERVGRMFEVEKTSIRQTSSIVKDIEANKWHLHKDKWTAWPLVIHSSRTQVPISNRCIIFHLKFITIHKFCSRSTERCERGSGFCSTSLWDPSFSYRRIEWKRLASSMLKFKHLSGYFKRYFFIVGKISTLYQQHFSKHLSFSFYVHNGYSRSTAFIIHSYTFIKSNLFSCIKCCVEMFHIGNCTLRRKPGLRLDSIYPTIFGILAKHLNEV